MNADQTYKIVLYAVAKNNSQGYVSPDDFNRIMDMAQRSYLDYLLGEYQKYQATRPVAIVEFGQTEKIRQSISPLIYNTVLPVDAVTGLATPPSDFEIVDAMWSQYGFYNIRFINQPRLQSFYRSKIDRIEHNPVYLLREEGIQFYPENISFARMSYVRTPPSIVWGYTLDSNGLPAYNPLTSQDPIWGDTDMLNIVVRALAMIGVNLQFGTVLQYSNEIKNNGQ